MPRAIWNDTTVAESDDTVVVEGNHYFNPAAAWYDPTPEAAAAEIAGRVAFWHGVQVDGG